MKQNYKSAWTLVKWFGAFLLFLGCFGWLMYNTGKNSVKCEVKTTIQIDTVYQKEVVKVQVRVTKTNTIAIHDTLYLKGKCDSIRTYSDSTITDKFNVYYSDTVCGLLLSKGLNVLLKVPIEITKTITNTTTEFKAFRVTLYGGGVVSVNSKLIVYPALNLALPTAIYTVGYDPINKTYVGGVGIKLFKIK